MNEHAVGIDASRPKVDDCVVKGEKFKTKVGSSTADGHRALDQ